MSILGNGCPSAGRIVRYTFRNHLGLVVERPAFVIESRKTEGNAMGRCDLAVMIRPDDVGVVADQGAFCLQQYLYINNAPNQAVPVPTDAKGELQEFADGWMPNFWHWPTIQQHRLHGTPQEDTVLA